MEKLKNLVNPGSKKDDEVMYGSGRSDDPVHTGHTNAGNTNTGSGQGSHFGSSRTAGHDPLSASSNSGGLSQHGRDTTTGTSQYDTATTGHASHGLSEPYASRMPGGFDNDDAATTASVSSGIPGHSQSRSAMTGANDPNFTDKPLPREPTSGTGRQSSLTGNSYPDRSIENTSRHGDQPGSSHLDRDAGLGAAAIGTHAHRHEETQRDSYAPETDRSFPLGGSSASSAYGSTTSGPHSLNLINKADPRIDSDGSRTTGNTGYGSTSGGFGSTAAGPHSSNLGNKADPRIDSDRSRDVGNTGYGSTSSGFGSTTAGPHSSNLANKADPRVDSDLSGATGNTGYRSTTGAGPSYSNQGSLGRDATGTGVGTTASGTTSGVGYGPESWQHDHQRHGHQFEGDPCETGAIGGHGGPHFVAGPHTTDTANRLDPHVNSGPGGAGVTSDTSEQHHHHGSHDHHGEQAALAGGAGAAGFGALKADHYNQGTTGNTTVSGLDSSSTGRHGLDTSRGADYDENRNNTISASSTSKTAGPHKSDMLNKLDPRVDSDLSKQQAPHSSDHHHRRDAGLAGAGGAGLYEAEKHHHGQESNLPSTSNASGIGGQRPYGSGIDPRVDTQRAGAARGQSATSSDHHYKRDAGLVGAGGVGAYEAQKHLGSSGRSDAATPQDRLAGSGHQPATATSSSPYPSSSYSHTGQPQTGSHTQHNPLAGGVFETGAIGRGENSHKTGDYGRTDPETQMRGPQYTGASAAPYSSSNQGNGSEKGLHTGHHTGRDAALVGGAGTGALAGHENSHKDASAYGSDPYHNASREHHTGRDAAIIGGAAGAGGLVEHEYSKKDAAKLQKEHAKEEKALEKEHSKEVKQHNKELAKEEKVHEKAIDKSEKKHEKAMEKEVKKHDKAIEKDETPQEHGGKKHGGLLGFLHREKPDKELKEEEAQRQAGTHPGHGEKDMAAGAGASGLESRTVYDPLQGEHGSQSGVHTGHVGTGSGLTTHDAYGAQDSGHNRLHKDPPSKVAESRGYEFQ